MVNFIVVPPSGVKYCRVIKFDFKVCSPKWRDFMGQNRGQYIRSLGASQTKGFRPLLDVFFPSIYQIFRASHNANRWRINNQIFANSQPVDARVKNNR